MLLRAPAFCCVELAQAMLRTSCGPWYTFAERAQQLISSLRTRQQLVTLSARVAAVCLLEVSCCTEGLLEVSAKRLQL